MAGSMSFIRDRPITATFVAAWVGIPSLLLVLIWLLLQGPVINTLLLWSLPPGTTDGLDQGQIDLLLSEIRSVAAGNVFGEPSLVVQAAAERYQHWQANCPLGHGRGRAERLRCLASCSPLAASPQSFGPGTAPSGS